MRTFASYGYWSGVPLAAGEMYHRAGRVVAAFPTDDGLTMVYVAAPLAEFDGAPRSPQRSSPSRWCASRSRRGRRRCRSRWGRERERYRRLRLMNDLTLRLAELRPRRVDHALFAALADRPAEIDRFLGALAGIVPAGRYFTPRTVLPLLGTATLRRLRT